MNENARKLAQLRAELEARGDGKCYFPCSDCRGLQRRRILRTTTERHCREIIQGFYQRKCLMSIGTFYLITTVIELQTKKNSMVKKRMEKKPRRMTPHLWN